MSNLHDYGQARSEDELEVRSATSEPTLRGDSYQQKSLGLSPRHLYLPWNINSSEVLSKLASDFELNIELIVNLN